MPGAPRMVFLGFGKYARADRIYALEPLRGEDRREGRRTRVWVEGIPEPIVASRTERTILQDMGQHATSQAPALEEALDLAARLATAADAAGSTWATWAGAPAGCSGRRRLRRTRRAEAARRSYSRGCRYVRLGQTQSSARSLDQYIRMESAWTDNAATALDL